MWMIDKRRRISKVLHAHSTTSIPTQGQIDKLGGGKTIWDLENRFELA
jgi:hypothetical protein